MSFKDSKRLFLNRTKVYVAEIAATTKRALGSGPKLRYSSFRIALLPAKEEATSSMEIFIYTENIEIEVSQREGVSQHRVHDSRIPNRKPRFDPPLQKGMVDAKVVSYVLGYIGNAAKIRPPSGDWSERKP